jgi:hypothetical protein
MTESPNPAVIDTDTLTGDMHPIRRTVVSLGSNLGDRMFALQGAVDALADTPEVWVTGVSPVYETAPVDAPEGSESFLNAVITFDTTLSWVAVGAVWFITAVTAGTAYLTWRTVHRERRRLTPQQGLARLVLGKTIDRLGAFALGGSVGVLISTIGVSGEGADRLVLRAAVAAFGAAAGVAAGLLLEHACRVPPGASGDLR